MHCRILELGAGTGALGLRLAYEGAMVDLTDLPLAIPLLERNIAANLPYLTYPSHAIPLRALPLDWTDLTTLQAFLPIHYDYIIAADVVYTPILYAPLLRVLQALATSHTPIPLILLGYEPYVEDLQEGEFYALASSFFSFSFIPLPLSTSRGCQVAELRYLSAVVEKGLETVPPSAEEK